MHNLVTGSIPFQYYSVERNCIEVPENDRDYDGCTDRLTSYSQDFVTSIFDDLNVGSIDFDGEACYYDDLTGSAFKPKLSLMMFLWMVCASYIFCY